MDCSDAAKMLIERMQTHPEEFAYGGKMYGVYEGTRVSARDKAAITAAYEKYILEPRLMAEVLQALLAQPEEEDIGLVKFKTQGRYAMGMTDPKLLYGSPVRNEGQPIFDPVNDEMYENHIQAHKSPIKKRIQAVAAEKESIAAQIYNKAFGRED